jgi:hypothetical protein
MVYLGILTDVVIGKGERMQDLKIPGLKGWV